MNNRPSLEDITLGQGQVLRARVVYPLWALDEGKVDASQGRLLFYLEEKRNGVLYSSSEIFFTIIDDIKVVEVIITTLKERLDDFMNPPWWFCSDCCIYIPEPERNKPCPGCGKLLGVDVDVYCRHGLAIDIACDACGRGGFRFQGFNYRGKEGDPEYQFNTMTINKIGVLDSDVFKPKLIYIDVNLDPPINKHQGKIPLSREMARDIANQLLIALAQEEEE